MRGHLPPVVPTSALLGSLPHYMKNEKLKVLIIQLCQTLSDPRDCSLLGFSVHGILQARILEWVSIPCSRGSS